MPKLRLPSTTSPICSRSKVPIRFAFAPTAEPHVTEPDAGSNPSDDKMIAVLEDHGDDPVVEELTSFISCPSEDEQIDLVALAWLGRDDNTIEDWPELRAEAARAHRTRTTHTADSLLGTPLLSAQLE